MANRKVNLNLRSNEEELDLNLCLGNNKGKRIIEELPLPEKKRKVEREKEEDSTGRSAEDKLALIEQKLDDIQKQMKFQSNALAARIDNHFVYASQVLCYQQSKSIECLNQIYSTLQQISQSLQRATPGPFSFTFSKPSTPSTSKRPPRP